MTISNRNYPTTILFGADVEISHFFSTHSNNWSQIPDQLLLNEMPGVPAATANFWKSSIDAYEYGRVFDPNNGSSYYSELGHLETCVPLCSSAKELVAYVEANRQRIRDAQRVINERSGGGSHLTVLFESRCGRGFSPVSIGTHYNYLIQRDAWERICLGQHPAVTGFVASVMAGIQLISGQGCVGVANGRPVVEYQISQRSDFITKVCCLDTMGQNGRGLINTRDEPECGRSLNDLARFHHICLDFPVNEFALFTTAGLVSLILASVSLNQVDVSLILDDPVHALWLWSHDPDFTTTASLANGRLITSGEYLSMILAFLSSTPVRSGLERYIRSAEQILECATQTSDAFLRRDWAFLARRIDWVLKRQILLRTMENNPHLNWSSPEIGLLDQFYGSADSSDSLYISQRECAGVVRIVNDAEISEAMLQPPTETRSWGHTMLLRRLTKEVGFKIISVNWDHITVQRLGDGVQLTAWFNDPHRWSRENCSHLFRLASIHDVLLGFEATPDSHADHWLRTRPTPHTGNYGLSFNKPTGRGECPPSAWSSAERQ